MIIIVSTGTKQQEEYWQNKLQSIPSAKVIVVYEEWQGGAGNGLGTLYAYAKGREKGLDLYGFDLMQLQKEGTPVALFHTAGKGQRLAPLVFSEYNNKSALQLPQTTVLESVIAEVPLPHPGRLSVFWGDQIFIPDHPLQSPKSHIEILAQHRHMPNASEWETQSLHNYGWVLKNKDKEILIDKCDFPFFEKVISQHEIDKENGIGISLGCFNLSFAFTEALLQLFDRELREKQQKMDTDPLFWMPLVLDKTTYLEIMKKKETPSDSAIKHFERMQRFREDFCKKHPELPLFGSCDIGAHSYWWDYGTISNYYQNMMKLTLQTEEAKRMRKFYHVDLNENNSCLIDCSIKQGSIQNSVLIGVDAEHLDVKDCLIIGSKFKDLSATQSVLYKVIEEGSLTLKQGTVRADLQIGEHSYKLYSMLERDGKEDWETTLPGNEVPYSYLYSLLSLN